jgi:hypothetical protein
MKEIMFLHHSVAQMLKSIVLMKNSSCGLALRVVQQGPHGKQLRYQRLNHTGVEETKAKALHTNLKSRG